ncbi:MAG: hypothetical protein IMF19_12360 [Proteobacteria bacterium]|nr:hypothetical protein [Pseudomonadota bacterium]
MYEKFQLKGGISEVNIGYNAKMGGYTTLMSDIPKLGKILVREMIEKTNWRTK